jgi:PAS domain S-box-containing protein
MQKELIKVLHVDDEENDRELTNLYITRLSNSIEIIGVPSARKGLEVLQKRPVDCILSDFQMPDMDGLSFLKYLNEKNSEIPFIFLTGQGNESIAAKALREGAADYFSKHEGFAQYDRLVNSIIRCVESNRQQLEKQRIENDLVQFGEILDNLENEIYLVDTDTFRINRVNKTARENLQYSEEELRNLRPWDVIVASDIETLKERIKETAKAVGNTMRASAKHRRKDGSLYPVESYVQTMNLDGKRLMVAMSKDLTEKMQASELQQNLLDEIDMLISENRELRCYKEIYSLIDGSERILEKLVRGSAEILMKSLVTDAQVGVRIAVNDHCYETPEFCRTGHIVSETISTNGSVAGRIECSINAPLRFEDPQEFTTENKRIVSLVARNLGHICYSIITAGSVKKPVPETIEAIGLKAEDFYLFFENHMSMMLMIDAANGRIINANKAARKFYGLLEHDLGAIRISDINQLSLDVVQSRMRCAYNYESNHFVFPHKTRRGDVRMVEVYSSPVEVNGRKLLFSVIHELDGKVVDYSEKELRAPRVNH